jgi:DHA1 family tetracycline resistance protein-like MFS transporter
MAPCCYSVYAFIQFLFAPVIGNLSDKFGRRPVLLASLLGFGIDYLFLAFSTYIWLVICWPNHCRYYRRQFYHRLGIYSRCKYSRNQGKEFRDGLELHLAWALSLALHWAVYCRPGRLKLLFTQPPFFVLLNCLYGYFVLPESLSKENRLMSFIGNGQTHWGHYNY